MKRSKPTPAEVANEQRQDMHHQIATILDRSTEALLAGDYAEVAAMHRAVTGVVRRMQERAAARLIASRGGDAIGDATDDLDAGLTGPVLS